MKDILTMIRPYRPDDADSLVDIWRAASARAHSFLPQSFLDQEADNMRHIYLVHAKTSVTELDGRTVGFIAMIDDEIGGLFLHPNFHGQGLGRAMVDHVRPERKSLNVEVFDKNAIGRRFYETYGFEYVGEALHAPSGERVLKLQLPMI